MVKAHLVRAIINTNFCNFSKQLINTKHLRLPADPYSAGTKQHPNITLWYSKTIFNSSYL